MRNRHRHQRLFVLAAGYNLTWGAFSVWHPQWLWQLSHMPDANHPQIFATLGMVIGLYGIVYLEVARRPEDGFVLAAVGLAGKLLGPIGLAYLIVSGAWPMTTMIICISNDLIWWIPFARYLHDAWPMFMLSLSTTFGPAISKSALFGEVHVN